MCAVQLKVEVAKQVSYLLILIYFFSRLTEYCFGLKSQFSTEKKPDSLLLLYLVDFKHVQNLFGLYPLKNCPFKLLSILG